MTQNHMSAVRAFVVAGLLLATGTLMFVTVSYARAAGALATGPCAAYGEALDYRTIDLARNGSGGTDCVVRAFCCDAKG